MKKIAVIDPYMIAPAESCFSKLRTSFPELMWSYHEPHHDNFQTLKFHHFDAYIILGSASHVAQKLAWQIELKNYILNELENKKPVLGICFGHQLMCEAFGAEVGFYFDNEEKISGLGEIKISSPFLNFFKDETLNFAVTHRQVVKSLPNVLHSFGLRLSPSLENDLVFHETLPFIGTQAHIEASDSFCLNESHILDENERNKSQTSSIRFLNNFFRYFNLVSI